MTGHPPAHTSLISRDQLETMGKELIHLCDQLEQHGLVDYQLGIWEEEILCGALYLFYPQFLFISFAIFRRRQREHESPIFFSPSNCKTYPNQKSNLTLVLGQCLDVIESRPELLRVHALPEPAAAAPRP